MPNDKPNDSTMKAAEIDVSCPAIRKLAAGIIAAYGFAGPPNCDELMVRIDRATNLTAKEDALLELIAAVDKADHCRCLESADIFPALAKAKKVMGL